MSASGNFSSKRVYRAESPRGRAGWFSITSLQAQKRSEGEQIGCVPICNNEFRKYPLLLSIPTQPSHAPDSHLSQEVSCLTDILSLCNRVHSPYPCRGNQES